MGYDWLKEQARGQAVKDFDAALPPGHPVQSDSLAEGLGHDNREKALQLCLEAERIILAGGGDLAGYFLKLAINELERAGTPADKELPKAFPRRGYTYR